MHVQLCACCLLQSCDRIGRGKGYYDTFLQRLARVQVQAQSIRPANKPYTIGIGFSVQLADKIPTEPHDMKLDEVILGHGDAA